VALSQALRARLVRRGGAHHSRRKYYIVKP
jgi:hypothetical protein